MNAQKHIELIEAVLNEVESSIGVAQNTPLLIDVLRSQLRYTDALFEWLSEEDVVSVYEAIEALEDRAHALEKLTRLADPTHMTWD